MICTCLCIISGAKQSGLIVSSHCVDQHQVVQCKAIVKTIMDTIQNKEMKAELEVGCNLAGV